MRQEINVVNNQVIVNLTGSMFVEEAAILRKQLLSYHEAGYKEFCINLSAVDYIDSSGLGVLVGAHKRALESGGSVIVTGLTGTVQKLFELTRLTKVFDIR